MLIAALIVLNIPVYLFIGWLVFDTKEDAAETFFETTVAILKTIFFPRIVRIFMNDDEEEDSWGILPIAAFLFACGAIVYGEHYLIIHYLRMAPDNLRIKIAPKGRPG